MDNLIESYDDFMNEARSDFSKIAKKSGTDKSTVDTIQNLLDKLDAASVAEAIATRTGIDAKTAEKVIKNMMKVYGGDIQIRVRS